MTERKVAAILVILGLILLNRNRETVSMKIKYQPDWWDIWVWTGGDI